MGHLKYGIRDTQYGSRPKVSRQIRIRDTQCSPRPKAELLLASYAIQIHCRILPSNLSCPTQNTVKRPEIRSHSIQSVNRTSHVCAHGARGIGSPNHIFTEHDIARCCPAVEPRMPPRGASPRHDTFNYGGKELFSIFFRIFFKKSNHTLTLDKCTISDMPNVLSIVRCFIL
jgi:hypothetical protein